MTLTEATDITEYRATMETGTSSSGTNMETYEENLFLNVEEVRSAQPSINTTDVPGFTDDKVAALNGSVPSRMVGPAKLIAVSAGDQISVTVDSYHTGNTSAGVQDRGPMVSAIVGLFGGQMGGGVEQQAIYDLFNGVNTAGFMYSGSSSTAVKAYLNVLVFDHDFNFVSAGGFDRADQASGYKTLSRSVTVSQGGYVYVYLSNESTANFEVYFDNLNITHTKGAILQEDHYYPFGANISALSSTAPLSKPNRYKLSGNEEQVDFDFDVYDFNARFYDPTLGRFMNIDPLADKRLSITPYNYVQNNPILRVDPLGTVDDYNIYSDGRIEVLRTDDETDSFTYNDSEGNEYDLGTQSKNENGLIGLEDFSFKSADGSLSIGFSVKNTGKAYVKGEALAALYGALADNNTSDLSIMQFSTSDGNSPDPSGSHKDGEVGDLRYLRSDKSGGRVNVWDVDLDWDRQSSFNSSLKKFGWTSLLSEEFSPGADINGHPVSSGHPMKLPNTTHYAKFFNSKGEALKNPIRHYHHLHVQRFKPNLKEVSNE